MKTVIDYIEVWSINLCAISLGFITDLSEGVKITAGLVAIGYTSWKWYHEVQEKKQLKKKK